MGYCTIANLEVGIESENAIFGGGAGNTRLLVLSNTSLEEVGLALQGNELHPIEGVGDIVLLVVTQGLQQAEGREKSQQVCETKNARQKFEEI
jgi:hypothetical protein